MNVPEVEDKAQKALQPDWLGKSIPSPDHTEGLQETLSTQICTRLVLPRAASLAAVSLQSPF